MRTRRSCWPSRASRRTLPEPWPRPWDASSPPIRPHRVPVPRATPNDQDRRRPDRRSRGCRSAAPITTRSTTPTGPSPRQRRRAAMGGSRQPAPSTPRPSRRRPRATVARKRGGGPTTPSTSSAAPTPDEATGRRPALPSRRPSGRRTIHSSSRAPACSWARPPFRFTRRPRA